MAVQIKESPVIRPSLIKRLDTYRGVLALVAVFIAGTIFSPVNPGTHENVFLRSDVQVNLLRFISEFGILAAGMTFVILSGGIDLSVGSVLALSSMTFTWLLIRAHWPAPAALAAGVAIGAFCGTICGAIISFFKLQPFV